LSFLSSLVAAFLVGFPALVSIVNPLGGALIYSQVTADRSHADRQALAWRVAFYSAMVMLTALWIGATLLGFFGVSIEALRIGGGLVVAVSGWRLLTNADQEHDRKQEQALPASGAADVAFFPLTIPFTAGPGTISVAITLSATRPYHDPALAYLIGISGAALAVAAAIGLCYASADRLVDLLGPARARILTRLTAFLLLCIGVQILITGVREVLHGALQLHP